MNAQTTGAGATRALVSAVRDIRWEETPDDAREAACQCLLDFLGCALAGSRQPLAQILLTEIAAREGSSEATLLGRQERCSRSTAALLNGAAGHALDFDDTHMVMGGHPSVPVIPAALALAETIGASGLSNIVFRRRRSEDWLREHADAIAAGRQVATDFMLVDPPRGGVEGAGRHLIRAAPVEICYVSCNPATLSRDLARLIKHGYRIEKLLGLDLFPQTYHVETIARLRL